MPAKRNDLVVFGATSFVGQILCRYLLEQFGVDGRPSWAMAGRSMDKLERVRSSLGRKASRLPLLVADASDEDSLRNLCAQARVIVSTVGPYALHGEPLVKVCTETGTDYCDLTGEVQWIRRMIRSYEPRAKKSGARIVHCCGFDSIPSDLGVHFLQQASQERYGKPCTSVKMRVKSAQGGFSGGTVASLMNVLKEVSADPKLRKELANPYSLCPRTHAPGVRQPQVTLPEFDADFESWVAPFVMAAINTRIVHRSNALSKRAYGRNFRYDEAVLTGRGLKGRLAATGLAAGIAGLMAAGSLAPLRAALGRLVLPEPGEGPSEEQQAKGSYDLRFFGRTADGQTLRAKVTGDRDPGYGSTAKMLGQAAACLALDTPRQDTPGGFWTPATIFGQRLTDRLVQHAGISFELLDP
jgi:short subunit dehydrogenase-like uncharacterized protein